MPKNPDPNNRDFKLSEKASDLLFQDMKIWDERLLFTPRI